MVKNIFLSMIILLGAQSLNADALSDKIINLIGEKSYNVNKNFINKIFVNSQNFYTNSNLNVHRVVRELTTNGLLVLRFSKPESVELTFKGNATPVLITRSANSLLSTMGYSYYEVKKAEYKDGFSTITFSFVSEHAPDPVIVLEGLRNRGFGIIDLEKIDSTKWIYTIDPVSLSLSNAKNISIGNHIDMKEVSGEYWLALKSVGTLEVASNNPAGFAARVVFYDRNLNIIDVILKDTIKRKTQVKVPDGARFVMLSDSQNPQSLKGGIKVRFF